MIENSHDLAAVFAQTVTALSGSPHDWVARNGDNSLFSVLNRMLPEVFTSKHHEYKRSSYLFSKQAILNSLINHTTDLC